MEQIKLKYLCFSYSTPITQDQIKESGIYKVYGASGLVGYSDDAGCKKDYLGIIKDGAGVGRISKYEKDSSLLGTMAYIIPFDDVDIDWLKYAVMSLNLSESISKTTIPHIYFSDYGNRTVGYCSISEQHRIADFLDRKCAEIDSVIEKTNQTIEEYKTLKQSIITEAVTKGVRGERPMKDSGIEWIGQIPAEWSVSRVGLHYDIILGKMLCSSQPSDDYTLNKYLCAANVHFDGISDLSNLKEMWFSQTEKEIYRIKDGDMLVVEGGAGAGGCAIVENISEDIFIQNSIMIVRSRSRRDNRYLRYYIEYLVKQGYIDVVCNKATIPHFTKDKLATVPYPVSPNAEQQEIADYLDAKCAEIDKLIEAKTKLLEELEAYKKSVIYEYVTGKKEVNL